VADLVLEGTVELGWVGMEFKDSRLLCEPFCRDRLVVIAPPHHPACGKRVKPRDLEGETFIWREGGSGTRTHMVRLLSKAGLKPDPEKGLILGSTTSVIQAVAAGMGLSLVSAWAAETWLKAGKIGRIRWEEETTRWFYTLRLRRRHPGSTASSFLDFLASRKEELRGILESLST
jgi:DNA-binding transcriptional LysR family regulator